MHSCFTTGAVTGGSNIDDLAGASSTISDCCKRGDVSDYSLVGGFAGSNDGTVSCDYFTGSVTDW
jgi:hypothetical protein